MEKKYQVVSLELSRKLKELGFKQESLFYWLENENGDYCLECINDFIGTPSKLFYSAYTVAELGEMLPDNYNSYKKNKEWFCRFKEDTGYEILSSDKENEANARAKMLIYLKENKLI